MKKYLTIIPFILSSFPMLSAHNEGVNAYQERASKQYEMGDYSSKEANAPAGPFVKCGWDMNIGAEFLYWYSNLTDMPIYQTRIVQLVASDTNPGTTRFSPLSSKEMDWSWDPGMRLSLGVVSDYDGWDFNTNWTYFYNSSEISKSQPALARDLSNALVGQKDLLIPFAENPADRWNSVKARYQLLFNQIDLEMGRHFWLSQCLTIRYFFGVRGLWAKTRLTLKNKKFLNDTVITGDTNVVELDKHKVSNWGVGLLVGVRSNWYFNSHWSLYTEGKFALPYGKSNLKRIVNRLETDAITEEVDEQFREPYFHAAYSTIPMLDLGIGMQFDRYFACRRCHLALIAGWEAHYLFDFNKIDRNWENGTDNRTILESIGNLFLSGGVVKIRFQF